MTFGYFCRGSYFQACTFRGLAGMVVIESLNRKWDETKKAIFGFDLGFSQISFCTVCARVLS